LESVPENPQVNGIFEHGLIVLSGESRVKYALNEYANQRINEKHTQVCNKWAQEENMLPGFTS
jgi:hypothetical protein